MKVPFPDSSPNPSPQPSRFPEETVTLLLIGLVLLYALWTLHSPSSPPPAGEPADGATAKSPTPEVIPLVTGEEPVSEIFARAGCPVCHAIPGISGARGQVGPPLVLGTTGIQRLGDPSYRGQARTVREYIVESVLNPGLFVVPGYPERTMPTWYGMKLSAMAVEKIADYLEQQTASPATR